MNDPMPFVMPLVWAVAATAVALLLYKTSESFLEGDSVLGLPVKGVRLTGSVVIFLLTYYMVAQATHGLRQDRSKSQVDVAVLGELRSLATSVDTHATEMTVCAERGFAVEGCSDKIHAVKQASERMLALLGELPDAEAPGETN